jgi:hypothetical protein
MTQIIILKKRGASLQLGDDYFYNLYNNNNEVL